MSKLLMWLEKASWSKEKLTCLRWGRTGWERWCPQRLSAGRAPVYTDTGPQHCRQKASVTSGAGGESTYNSSHERQCNLSLNHHLAQLMYQYKVSDFNKVICPYESLGSWPTFVTEFMRTINLFKAILLETEAHQRRLNIILMSEWV